MKKIEQTWSRSWFWRVTMWYDLWERRPMHRTICLCGWQSGQLSEGNKIWQEPNLNERDITMQWSFYKQLLADDEDGDNDGNMVFRMTIEMGHDDHWYNICWQPRVGRGQILAGICLISFISLLYCLVSTFCISFILWSMISFSLLLISLV